MAATGTDSAEVIPRSEWLSSFTYSRCWLKVAEAAPEAVDWWSQIRTFINHDFPEEENIPSRSVKFLMFFYDYWSLKSKNVAGTDFFFSFSDQTGRTVLSGN